MAFPQAVTPRTRSIANPRVTALAIGLPFAHWRRGGAMVRFESGRDGLRQAVTRTRILMAAVVLGAVASSISCENAVVESFTEGPPLNVEVEVQSLALQPTGSGADRCCCTILGRATNLSTVAVHATIKLEAFAPGEAEPIGTAVDFMEDFQPGEERQIRASGLLMPCSRIERFELVEVDVRGIWFPRQ